MPLDGLADVAEYTTGRTIELVVPVLIEDRLQGHEAFCPASGTLNILAHFRHFRHFIGLHENRFASLRQKIWDEGSYKTNLVCVTCTLCCQCYEKHGDVSNRAIVFNCFHTRDWKVLHGNREQARKNSLY
jgi:hypothetical protein